MSKRFQVVTTVKQSVVDQMAAEADLRGISCAALIRQALLWWLNDFGDLRYLDTRLDEAQALIDELRVMRERLRKCDAAPETGA